jgi:hypothetical protein
MAHTRSAFHVAAHTIGDTWVSTVPYRSVQADQTTRRAYSTAVFVGGEMIEDSEHVTFTEADALHHHDAVVAGIAAATGVTAVVSPTETAV